MVIRGLSAAVKGQRIDGPLWLLGVVSGSRWSELERVEAVESQFSVGKLQADELQ